MSRHTLSMCSRDTWTGASPTLALEGGDPAWESCSGTAWRLPTAFAEKPQ